MTSDRVPFTEASASEVPAEVSASEVPASEVPGLAEALGKAQELVGAFFAHRKDDLEHGTIEISGERYILVRAASLSVEFFALVEKLYGPDRVAEVQSFARNILFDLSHAIGKSDARRFHAETALDDPLARLATGPVHFAHSGWAKVEIVELSTSEPHLIYDHPYSFESDAWIQAGRKVDFPVCIMNAGYSSGWCEESFGTTLVASEIRCRARGDASCRFIMAPPDALEARVEAYLKDKPELRREARGYEIPDLFARKSMEEELRAARDELEVRVANRTIDLALANQQLKLEMEGRERILRRLQNTQRLESLGRLAGGVAHDFNNLLGVIMGYSSILEGRVPPDDPMRPMLAEITEAAQLAAHLTRQLLTFSRARVLAQRRIDLHEVVIDVSKMLKRLVGDDVKLRTHLGASTAVVEADPTQMEQMLMNLAVNARDAMPDGGSIKIETEAVDGEGRRVLDPTHLRLSVADTGRGMDEATQAKIFEPFFTTKESTEGTGLGLSTVYGIVAQVGGSIRVDSAPGCGARFEILLPLADGDADPTTGRPPSGPRPEPRHETVLLVEDRISLRALLAESLDDDGYEVLVAHDAEDALRLAKQHPGRIHVLATDVMMPGISGEELASAVIQERPDIRILFMSGFAAGPPEVEEKGFAERQVAFIAKPFTPHELRGALHRLLRA
ncbi:MAG: response regulator [Myxococcales bacterium]|nr:response regulator [Myxococcales bacterium]